MLKKLTSIGLHAALPTTEVRKVKVLNQLCGIAIAGSVLFLVISIIKFPDDWVKWVTLLIDIVLIAVCLWLQYMRRYFLARLLLMSLTVSVFFIHANYSFQGFYGEYLYLSVPMASLFFFDRSWIQYVFLVLSVVLFYVPNYYFEIYPEQYFGYANVALMFVSFFFLVRYFKVLNQKNELALADQKELAVGLIQQKFLQSQLNPHFIFNALEMMQNDVLNNRPEKAASSLTKFSRLMRQTLEHSREDFISLADELESLHNYIAATKVGMRNEFDFSVSLADDLDSEFDKIPPMMIQPFLENAIEHGVVDRTDAEIVLKLTKVDNAIQVALTDNGKGLEKQRGKKEYRSISTSIIHERLELLSQKDGRKYDLKVKNRKGQPGVEVIMLLPLQG